MSITKIENNNLGRLPGITEDGCEGAGTAGGAGAAGGAGRGRRPSRMLSTVTSGERVSARSRTRAASGYCGNIACTCAHGLCTASLPDGAGALPSRGAHLPGRGVELAVLRRRRAHARDLHAEAGQPRHVPRPCNRTHALYLRCEFAADASGDTPRGPAGGIHRGRGPPRAAARTPTQRGRGGEGGRAARQPRATPH